MNAKLDGVCKRLFLAFLFLLLAANCASGQATPRVVEAVDNTKRVTLAGNVHPLARAEYERGAVDNVLPMTRILMLLQRGSDQEAAVETFLEQQQDKSSPNYHVWLNPQQFGAQYGPADSDIQAVTRWLQSEGFTINKIYSGKTIIEFSGNAGQVQTAFGVNIHNYQVNNNTYVANANDPQIPAALAPVVAGLVSLNNFPRQSHIRLAGQARKIPGQRGLQPLYTFPNPFGSSGNFYGLAPGDFATIYNSKSLIGSGNDGTGQTIAVVGETNINVADVQEFRQMFGLPATFTSANIILDGPDPGITSTGEESEADLDVQWSGAVAPGATVDFVVSASTSTSAGIDLSALYIIENNLAGVMSESYGACEAGIGTAGNAFYNALWEQAAAQGITVALSAGDGGSAGCDDFDTATVATQGLAVSGLASTPFNVAVGGTDFDDVNQWSTYWGTTNATTGNDVIGTSALSYIPEIPWNQNCAQLGLTGCVSPPQSSLNIAGGSGGYSTVYAKPKWQMGVAGMPGDGHRDLPDVSLFASPGFDYTGYLICQADQIGGEGVCNLTTGEMNFLIVGGTSASTPAFAGVMALVNQYQGAHGGTMRQGNANYVLYALAKKAGASCASSATEASTCTFNDITHGNSYLLTKYPGTVGTNSVPCQGGTPNCSVASGNGVLVEPTSASTEAWKATAGYDLATGLGSVNINNLAANWGTVSTVPTTTTLTLNPTTNITHGSSENVNVTIAVKPTTGTATGDVSLIATMTGSSGTTEQGILQYTLGAGGTVSGTTQNLPGGTYTVTAHYAGDGTNAPSDSAPPVQITVSPEPSKTFLDLATFDINGNPTSFTASSATYGSGFAIFRVDVGDAAAIVSSSTGISSNCSKGISSCPTGTVVLTSTGSSLGTSSMLLNILGYAETPPLPGTYSVTSSYPGDSSYGSSTGSANFTISKAPTTIAADYAGTPVQYGVIEQIGANVSTASTGVAPTGTFQFLVDGNPVGTSVRVYESAGYTPGATPTPYAWADAISTTSFMSVGNHSLSVQYSGDSNYAAGASPSVTVPVAKAFPNFTSIGASPNNVSVNQQVVLSAQVAGSGVAPTGTITFYGGPTALPGTVTYSSFNSSLSASMPYKPTVPGTFYITASYSGDGNYQPATTSGPPATVFVSGPDFTLAPESAPATVNSGSSATYTIAVAAIDGFAASVSFSCSLPAAATTCSANPSSVAPGSSTTITVTTTKHQFIPPMVDLRPFGLGARILLSAAAVALVVLLLLLYGVLVPQRRQFAAAALVGLMLISGLLAMGCGGGSSGGSGGGNPPTFGTQAGTYLVTITGTSGKITHTTTVILNVQ
jgi:subtilase family serine protease